MSDIIARSNTDQNPVLQVPEEMWDQFTPAIKKLIVREYNRIKASKSEEGIFEDDNVVWAASMLGMLRAISPVVSVTEPPQRKNWFWENITGLMLVTAGLTIIFGGFGLWGLWGSDPNSNNTVAQGFLDIAKLFAGALVGAAGAVGVGVATNK
ncbi:hypothetical protein KX729_19725 [Rhizobium sp. XQZ8]|uniref:hypothetical protein n=1 Tax=Rhizobium populisoli TaxID=2859785 RepID=UPI001CA4BE7E|nr:hypothetical protein [Rhizobium populisoli]MBW6423692.1 hypothetical protein [Rhizobium populisoli]